MHAILRNGLDKTAALWPAIAQGYRWVHQAAHLLNNEAGHDGLVLRREYRALLAEMQRQRGELGQQAGMVGHFRKVTKSYWTGLFRCYEQEGIPRTNNDLEQCFGSVRYHERRASGGKVGSPGLVVRGSVRLVAAVVTRKQMPQAEELRPANIEQWRQLRTELAYRHHARRCQSRFRRDPATYLRQLEDALLNPSLPP